MRERDSRIATVPPSDQDRSGLRLPVNEADDQRTAERVRRRGCAVRHLDDQRPGPRRDLVDGREASGIGAIGERSHHNIRRRDRRIRDGQSVDRLPRGGEGFGRDLAGTGIERHRPRSGRRGRDANRRVACRARGREVAVDNQIAINGVIGCHGLGAPSAVEGDYDHRLALRCRSSGLRVDSEWCHIRCRRKAATGAACYECHASHGLVHIRRVHDVVVGGRVRADRDDVRSATIERGNDLNRRLKNEGILRKRVVEGVPGRNAGIVVVDRFPQCIDDLPRVLTVRRQDLSSIRGHVSALPLGVCHSIGRNDDRAVVSGVVAGFLDAMDRPGRDFHPALVIEQFLVPAVFAD